MWGLLFVLFVLFIGLRHHVGMDWNNYLVMISRVNDGNFWEAIKVSEPGYAVLLWIAGKNGWGIYGAYLIGTLIFTAGLFRYANSTPSPWIALLVATPYLVIVIAMSAARQAVAVGVLLWLAAEWYRASVFKRCLLILLASTFHNSAIFFVGFVFVDLRVSSWMRVVASAIISSVALAVLSRSGQLDIYANHYGTSQSVLTHSSGAFFHVLMIAGPAALCILLDKWSGGYLIPDSLHRNMALLAIALLPLSLVYSTAASRLSIFLFPVSMWFFATLPLLLQENSAGEPVSTGKFVKIASILLMIIVEVFWLSTGNSAFAYLNYQNVLFMDPQELILCCK